MLRVRSARASPSRRIYAAAFDPTTRQTSMSEKTSTSDIADTITRCLDAIAHRQTLIAEVIEKIASARERALALSADAVLGRASEREAVNARAALEELEADRRTWQLEIDGLEER